MAWSLAFRLARRELRGGLKGFRIFLACLMLGLAVIAAVGSVAASVRGGLAADARTILGGDVELRLLYQPAKPEQLAFFAASAAVSTSEEMRAMSRPAVGDERALVELKAVDAAYPLYGSVALQPAMPLADALAQRDGRWGAAVDPNLLERLGLKVGDSLRVGDADFQIRAWIEQLKARFPDAVWRIRGLDDAAAGIKQFIDRTAMFLILVGLAALLVGGVGVGTAVRSYLQGKTATIATLKCLGASGALVFRAYLILILTLAIAGVAIGLALGAAVPPVVAGLLAARMSVDPQVAIFPVPLAIAAAFGMLSALGFSLWPLARARDIRAVQLFRDLLRHAPQRPRRGDLSAIGAVGAALAALVLAT